MKKVFVKLNWKLPEDGGRKNPPTGSSYVAIPRFKGDDSWPQKAWSMRIDFTDENEHSDYIRYGFARFLVSQAPENLLKPGVEFDLLEGPHSVAHVEILLTEQTILFMLKQMA
ncbi:MAG: hypothetical protein SF052_05980 [Bacteroidia bacterium]|nr:hypothetical protein [Bacteroidia bacterium]